MDISELTEVYQAGRHLQAKEIVSLEALVEANPDDLISRIRLLGYYRFNYKLDSPRYANHLLWIVDKLPDDPVADFVALGNSGLKRQNKKAYDLVKERWLLQVEASSASPIVSINASTFCQTNGDRRSALEMLIKAQALYPTNTRILLHLAGLYQGAANNTESLEKALHCYERLSLIHI